MRAPLGLMVALVMAIFSCGDDAPPGTSSPEGDGLYPDVVGVEVTEGPEAGTYRFDVTLSSPYDTPERYADAWRVRSRDGEVFGVRELAHDHQSEQPFTRSLDGVEVPEGVETVVVEGRDQVNGWGGGTMEVDLVSVGG